METVIFYRHWYIDDIGTPTCSVWQHMDWWEYLHGYHRDAEDMGDENPIIYLHTDKREFELSNNKTYGPLE